MKKHLFILCIILFYRINFNSQIAYSTYSNNTLSFKLPQTATRINHSSITDKSLKKIIEKYRNSSYSYKINNSLYLYIGEATKPPVGKFPNDKAPAYYFEEFEGSLRFQYSKLPSANINNQNEFFTEIRWINNNKVYMSFFKDFDSNFNSIYARVLNIDNNELFSCELSFDRDVNTNKTFLIDFFKTLKFKSTRENYLNTTFESNKGGWLINGDVTTALDTLNNGRLKVSKIDKQWEGIKNTLPNFNTIPGDVFDIAIDFDKGNTNAAVRLYIEELDANGKHLSWNGINWNMQTGSYKYKYTIKKGSKFYIRLDKSNTHLNEISHFYIDNFKISKRVVDDK